MASSPFPYDKLDGLLTGSGLHDYLNAVRAADMKAYDAQTEAAVQLERAIRRAGNGKMWAAGVDLRFVASRVARPLKHAGALHLEAAKAAGTAWAVYSGSLTAQGGKVHSGVFDPTK